MHQRLPALRAREVIRALERAGFTLHHQTGSHAILYKTGHPRPVSVPMHPGDLKRGLLMGILKDAGLSPEEFTELL